MIVDDAYECLRGEPVRKLLEACGGSGSPRPVKVEKKIDNLYTPELKHIRNSESGYEGTNGEKDRIEDWRLDGFEDLIEILPALSPEQRKERARLIWESLGDLEKRRSGVFDAVYRWFYYTSREALWSPSAFIKHLTESAWVPDGDGELQPPRDVIFDSLGWNPDPFLSGKIAFKPPIIDQRAKAAGFDPEVIKVIDFVQTNNITMDDMMSKFPGTGNEDKKDTNSEVEGEVAGDAEVYKDAEHIHGDDDVGRGGSGAPGGGNRGGVSGGGSAGTSGHQGRRSPGANGGRPFVSYLATHPGMVSTMTNAWK